MKFNLLILFFSLFILNNAVLAFDSNLVVNLQYGEHSVGFTSVNLYDKSRVYPQKNDEFGNLIKGEGFRPVQTLIWYPAVKEKGAKNMLYEEYVYNNTNIENLVPPTDSTKSKIIAFFLNNKYYDKERIIKELSTNTSVYKNAQAKHGSFPIIVYAPSWGQIAWENAALCEFLASHGYIVVSSPSLNKDSRDMTDDIDSLNAQAKDMEFLVDYMKDFPNTNYSKIAFMGYSWGGTSNIIAAQRLKHIDALVSLDGAIVNWYSQYKNETQYLDPLKMNIPFLAITGAPASEETIKRRKMDSSFIFYESLKYSEAYWVTFLEMAHGYFQSRGLKFSKPNTNIGEMSQQDRNHRYSLMTNYILNFFNATIKNSEQSELWLKKSPEEHNIAEGIMFSWIQIW